MTEPVETIADIMPVRNTLRAKHYDYAPVTSDDDASLYSIYANEQNGFIKGRGNNCTLSFNSGDKKLIIDTGDILCRGRLGRIVEPVIYTLNTFGDLKNRMFVMVIDLNKENSYSGQLPSGDYQFNNEQLYFALLDANVVPVQEDILNGGKVYMLPICKWDASSIFNPLLIGINSTVDYMKEQLPGLVEEGLPDAVREVGTEIITEIAGPVLDDLIYDKVNTVAPEILASIMPGVVDARVDEILPSMLPLPVAEVVKPILDALIPLTLEKRIGEIMLRTVYPVGTVYYTDSPTLDPNVSFGGIWKKLWDKYSTTNEPRNFLIGVPNSEAAEKDIGKLVGSFDTGAHTLTLSQIPSHIHSVSNVLSNIYINTTRNPSGSAGRFYVNRDTRSSKSKTVFGGRDNSAADDSSDQLYKAPSDMVKVNTSGGGASHSHTLAPRHLCVAAWVRMPDPLRQVTILGGSGSGAHPMGDIVTIIASAPEPGYVFSNWQNTYLDVYLYNNESPETSFVMPNHDVILTAIYEQEVIGQVELAVNYGSGSGTYDPGTEVAISADIPAGSRFDKWISDTGVDVSIANPLEANTTIIIGNKDVSLTATFLSADYYEYKIVDTFGKVVDSGNAKKDSIVTFKGVEYSDDIIDNVMNSTKEVLGYSSSVSGVVITNGSSDIAFKEFTMPASNIVVTADWKWNNGVGDLVFMVDLTESSPPDFMDKNIAIYRHPDLINYASAKFRINWGDDSPEETFDTNYEAATHTYDDIGQKFIRIFHEDGTCFDGVITSFPDRIIAGSGLLSGVDRNYRDLFMGATKAVALPEVELSGKAQVTQMFSDTESLDRIQGTIVKGPGIDTYQWFSGSGINRFPKIDVLPPYDPYGEGDQNIIAGCQFDFSMEPTTIYTKKLRLFMTQNMPSSWTVMGAMLGLGNTNYKLTQDDVNRGYIEAFFLDDEYPNPPKED